ncbi:MAG TPA: peptidylprolyl isomerase [Saprospiraceae bacterium]|nr:peptidylprolyl isomerase [Saprospiraceae bacterium]
MFQKVNIYLFFLLVFLTSCAKPMASFMVNTKDNTAPAKVNFDNQSKKAETYLWDFGDGTTSTEISPKHKYITSGKYTVKLTATKGKKTHTMEKELIFEAPHDCLIEMETTLGSITIKLHDSTPQHRDNFIKLAETEYYDNMLFHRVINGFMIQGGDPDSKNAKKGQRLGVGGPGYTVPAEFVDGLIHIKGALSAARQGDAVNPEKRSSGSQFYLVQGKPLSAAQLDQMEWQKGYKYTAEQREILTTQGGTPFLDKDYTVFGQIVKGLDIIDKIAAVQTDGADRPLEDVKILKVRVIK